MTFFHCANASKAVKLSSGKRVAFDVYHYFAGAWLGIAAVEDQETIDGLTELTFKAKSGITQIDEAEYNRCSQKKNPQRNSRPSPESPLPQPRVSPPIDLVRGVPARLVEKAAEKPAEPFPTPKVYDSIDEVLKIGVVKPMEQTVKVKVKPKAKEAVK
jgi:hypothetical protein